MVYWTAAHFTLPGVSMSGLQLSARCLLVPYSSVCITEDCPPGDFCWDNILVNTKSIKLVSFSKSAPSSI